MNGDGNSGLIRWNRAKQAIKEAHSVDEVKLIRDRAEAMRAYAKQIGEGLTAQNRLAEIKIRAERHMGEMLAEAPKQHGSRPPDTGFHDGTPQTLSDIGVSKKQSHRWQTMAELPEERFEQHIAEIEQKSDELTSIGVLRLARKENRPTINSIQPLPEGVYDVVYADPPWKYDFSETESRAIETKYETMNLGRIKSLDIRDCFAENSVLFLWATAPKLLEALEVMRAWGFVYRTSAIWDKEIIGMGYWFRGQHELLLVGTKGSFSPPEEERRISSVIRERRREHSRKPVSIRKDIERMLPNGKGLEIFARPDSERSNYWTPWGLEI